MIKIHHRTPRSLEFSISSGRYVRYFIARRFLGLWELEEDIGTWIIKRGTFRLVNMFGYMRSVKKVLDNLEKVG